MRKTKKYIKGFSLIELSLALVIVSSMVVVMLNKYDAEKKNQSELNAVADLKNIKAAIQHYVNINGYYPCPTDPVISKTHAKFGIGLRDHDGNCNAANMAHNDDYVYHSSNHDCYDGLGYPSNESDDASEDCGNDYIGKKVILSQDIIMGAIPCLDIGLPRDCAFDPQGNRYSYAVIPELARSGNIIDAQRSSTSKACGKYLMSDPSIYNMPRIRVLKKVESTNIDIDHLNETYNYNDNANPRRAENTYEDQDFVVIYYGKAGIGAYPNDGGANLIISPQITSDYDSVNYQAINADVTGTRGNTIPNEYFLQPESPVTTTYIYESIIAFGKSTKLEETYCVKCFFLPNSPSGGGSWEHDKIINTSCPTCVGMTTDAGTVDKLEHDPVVNKSVSNGGCAHN